MKIVRRGGGTERGAGADNRTSPSSRPVRGGREGYKKTATFLKADLTGDPSRALEQAER